MSGRSTPRSPIFRRSRPGGSRYGSTASAGWLPRGRAVHVQRTGYHYLQFTARSDGAEYPETTDDLLADLIASNKATSRTYAEKIVDEYVTEWTDKVNGKVTGSGRKIVSKDGQTLTVTVDGSATVRIYDRQVTTAR